MQYERTFYLDSNEVVVARDVLRNFVSSNVEQTRNVNIISIYYKPW